MDTQPQQAQVPPGKGERTAIGGYEPQYVAAICLTLRALRYRRLREVRLADLDAGAVDDLILVEISNVVHGYQMKAHEGALTFNDFAREDGLLRQLANGWLELHRQFPGFDVQVHLLTNQPLSTTAHGNMKLPVGDPPPAIPHFQAFWYDAWLPFQEAVRESRDPQVPAAWLPAFDQWQAAAGLTADEFRAFAVALSLDPLPGEREALQYGTSDDLAFLYREYQKRVAEAKLLPSPVVVTAREVEDLLGVQFHLRNLQEFPVSGGYRPIQIVVGALNEAVGAFRSGYLAVVGSPGSGKSSLLTETLVRRDRRERVVRYYCHVPDEPYGHPPRGEAASFLHDLVLQLEQCGFSAGPRLPRLDTDRLRVALADQLEQLAADFRQTCKKTLIVIDGLDYATIDESGRLKHPLLEVLPQPPQLPDGVVIILGTQHLDGVDAAIRSQLEDEPKRRVEMSPLPRRTIVEVVRAAGLTDRLALPGNRPEGDPLGRRLARIADLCEGHPLALDYLLQGLQEVARSGEEIDAYLDRVPAYGGDIRVYYGRLWDRIPEADRDECRELVGLLARLRGPLDFRWMRPWPEARVLSRFERRFGHLFRKGIQDRWFFFHDSFRRFLLDVSATTIDGLDPELHKVYHRRLAERCQAAPPGSVHGWHLLFHLWEAGDNAAISQVVTPRLCEEQLLALRPCEDIAADLRLAVWAAAKLEDPVALWRAILLLGEYEQRDINLEGSEEDLLSLLVDLGRVEEAMAHVLSDGRLRLGRTSDRDGPRVAALNLCHKLARAGRPGEARQLFEVAESPYDLTHSILSAWADVAVLFRAVPDFVARVRRLRWVPDPVQPHNLPPEQIARHRQNEFILSAGRALLEAMRWSDLDRVVAAYDQRRTVDQGYRLRMLLEAWEYAHGAGNEAQARAYHEQLRREVPPDRLLARTSRLCARIASLEKRGHRQRAPGARERAYGELRDARIRLRQLLDARVTYAELLYTVARDQEWAARLLDGISWDDVALERTTLYVVRPEDSLIRICALRTALSGKRPSMEQVVRDADPSGDQAGVVIGRVFCRLAMLQGERWQGVPYDAFAFEQEVFAILCFHHARGRGDARWGGWTAVQSRLPSLCEWLITEAERRGPEALHLVYDTLRQAWGRPETLRYWSEFQRRRILVLWLRFPSYRDWAAAELRALLTTELPAAAVREQVEEALERARRAVDLDDRGLAEQWLARALSVALGVGQDKDYQIRTWVQWVFLQNRLQPEGSAARLDLCARRMLALRDAGAGGPDGSQVLVRGAFAWSPVRAVQLFWWFWEHRCLFYVDTMRDLVEVYAVQAEKGTALPLEPAVTVLDELVLPLTDDLGRGRAVAAAVECASARGRQELQKYASAIWQAGATECARRMRTQLAILLDNVLRAGGSSGEQIGISANDLVPLQEDQSSRILEKPLRLRSGEEIPFAQVCELVQQDYRVVPSLQHQEETAGDAWERFDWSEVVRRAVPSLTDGAAVRTLAQAITSGLHIPMALVALGERALKFGDVQLARDLGEEALRKSSPSGWQEYFDGGSRQAAFALLTRIHPSRYRPLAYQYLGEDLQGLSGKAVAEEFIDLLPTLGAEAVTGELCKVTEEYVCRLLAGIQIPDEPVEPLHAQLPVGDGPASALILLVLRHLTHPTTLVVARCLRALGELLLRVPEIAQPVIAFGLQQPDELLQERTLMVCLAAGMRDSGCIRPLVPEFQVCSRAQHLSIAHMAQRLLTLLGESVEHVPSRVLLGTTAGAPSLLVPDLHSLDAEGQVLGHQHEQYIWKLYGPEIHWVANMARMHESVLLRRIAGRMAILEKAPGAGIGEESLKAKLTPLRLPYNRPQALLARRAFNQVAGELVADGLLDGEGIQHTYDTLQAGDPRMLLWHPGRRLPDVPLLKAYDYGESPLKEIEEDLLLGFPQSDQQGDLILGERARLTGERLHHWEQREIGIVFAEDQSLLSAAHVDTKPFSHRPLSTAETYPMQLSEQADQIPLCVNAAYHWFDTLGRDWIAIAPEWARAAGWHPHSTETFSWVNASGDVMVRTVGWQDGTLSALTQTPDSGWRVVATPEAWETLKGLRAGLFWRVTHVCRGEEHDSMPAIQREWATVVIY